MNHYLSNLPGFDSDGKPDFNKWPLSFPEYAFNLILMWDDTQKQHFHSIVCHEPHDKHSWRLISTYTCYMLHLPPIKCADLFEFFITWLAINIYLIETPEHEQYEEWQCQSFTFLRPVLEALKAENPDAHDLAYRTQYSDDFMEFQKVLQLQQPEGAI